MKRCWSLFLLAGTALPALAHGQTDARRAYEAELSADAALRVSLLQDAPSPAAGWAKGKFFISDGGANTLNVGGFFQTRYLITLRDNQPDDTNDFTHGFQARRTRMNLSGSVWDKNLTFKIEGEFGRGNGVFTLTDAWGRYAWDNGVWARWGQAKVPLMREELVSDTLQLTVERSAMNAVFSQARSQLVEVGWNDAQFRLSGAFSDGLSTLNTDFTSPAEADLALTGRAEFMFHGSEWKRFDDNTSFRGSDYAGMAGAALHWQSGGETGGTTDMDIFQATADISVEGDGWNAFAAAVWRNTDTAASSADDLGFLAQAGFFATEQLEVFARYDLIVPDTGDNFNTATVGVNYYITPKSHALKVTGDVVWYFDPVSETPILSTSTGLPLLSDAEGDQIALRMQVQLLF